MFKTALIGCSGYAGQETLDRVLAHPELEVVALGSDSLAGEPPSALDLRLNGSLPEFGPNAEAMASGADVLFLCLGHDEAAAFEPPADAVVVDLSGGHRLRDAALYDDWYGFEHPLPGALTEWSYALPELYPPTSRLIANPGCYATAALLALGPLADAVEPAGIVVDAKSGVSGAGRALKATSHAGFVLENLSPYRIGSHQHAPELEQVLGFPVCFVDRKSTRLNSSHVRISYAVFCLKKKKKNEYSSHIANFYKNVRSKYIVLKSDFVYSIQCFIVR